MKFNELDHDQLLSRARKAEKAGDFEKCLKYLNRALDLYPNSYNILIELGTIYARNRCYDLPLSLSFCLRAIALDPNRYEGWNNAAWCSRMSRNRTWHEDTIAFYTRAYPLAPVDEQEEILSCITEISRTIENPLKTRLRIAKLRNSKVG